MFLENILTDAGPMRKITPWKTKKLKRFPTTTDSNLKKEFE